MGFVAGLVAGLVLAAAGIRFGMPRMMIRARRSRFGVDETVERIVEAAGREGWQVPKVYELHESLEKHGHPLGRKVRIVSLCKPPYAQAVLGREAFRRLSGIMPCRISVYEADDGTVWVAQMNTGLMGRMFGRFVGAVMGRVSEEEHRILQGVCA